MVPPAVVARQEMFSGASGQENVELKTGRQRPLLTSAVIAPSKH